ncbi:MAG: hypothetical protein K9K62_08125 [Desulfobacteraceae bacterium]|nr:hypothetical protein [Desulfobacteraceae bacterium]
MTHTDDDDIGAQVSSRLEELFGEDEPDEQEAPQAESTGRQEAEKPETAGKKETGQQQQAQSRARQVDDFDTTDSPLNELKALVFGIDWEINEESMVAFLKEVRQLQQQYGKDKILSTFLKLHESVGKYIKAKKSRAHPDALKFVASVFTSFEKALLTPGMSQAQKKRLLAEEIRKFKDFKEQVASKKKSGAPEPAAAVPAEQKPAAPEEVKPAALAEEEPAAAAGQEPAQTAEAESPAAAGETPVVMLDEESPPAAEQAPVMELEEESAAAGGEEPMAAAEEKPAAVLQNQEVIDYIVAELKKTIQAEFRTLHQILKNLGA